MYKLKTFIKYKIAVGVGFKNKEQIDKRRDDGRAVNKRCSAVSDIKNKLKVVKL